LNVSNQVKAIAAANTIIGFATTMQTLRSQIGEFVAEYNSEGYATLWGAMATHSQNADGSFNSADGTPVSTHPISTGSIERSANALTAGVTLIEDFQKFLTNQAVSTAQRSQTLDDLVS
jgi:hypothetical protein